MKERERAILLYNYLSNLFFIWSISIESYLYRLRERNSLITDLYCLFTSVCVARIQLVWKNEPESRREWEIASFLSCLLCFTQLERVISHTLTRIWILYCRRVSITNSYNSNEEAQQQRLCCRCFMLLPLPPFPRFSGLSLFIRFFLHSNDFIVATAAHTYIRIASGCSVVCFPLNEKCRSTTCLLVRFGRCTTAWMKHIAFYVVVFVFSLICLFQRALLWRKRIISMQIRIAYFVQFRVYILKFIAMRCICFIPRSFLCMLFLCELIELINSIIIFLYFW